MDTQRIILLFIFSFSLLLLWEAWQREQRPKPIPEELKHQGSVPVPQKAGPAPQVPRAPEAAPAQAPEPAGELVRVQTDLVVAEIDTAGATLRRLELLRHRDPADPARGFVLLGPEHAYAALSGLIGEGAPNHRSAWRVRNGPRELHPGMDTLEVRFFAEAGAGGQVEKIYVFRRDRYDIELRFEARGAHGATHAYYQLVRDARAPAGESALMALYTGPVVYTAEKAYQKVDFGSIEKDKADHPRQSDNGWIGMVQHYFVAAWLAPERTPREYYTRRLQDGNFAAGAIVPLAPAGEASVASVRLYAGPQEQHRLRALAPGLDLVVDYGWLAIIAWPLFAILEFFHRWTGNWGVAIILLTVLIKLVFFPLSAASYRSMARMKLVMPRLQRIRETYANDRAKMNQAMMELYKTERINPLGGCFPILVQIPVFIALYWVLLAAIELRHAPFVLWIKDLSVPDPYYVLPVLMAATMVIQARMNPPPPDPVQAQVMKFMPYVFSVFFFFFPAGLVLYWLVNNVLSILQQWQIQRMFERDGSAHGKRA